LNEVVPCSPTLIIKEVGPGLGIAPQWVKGRVTIEVISTFPRSARITAFSAARRSDRRFLSWSGEFC
jgi:hypothetical protein